MNRFKFGGAELNKSLIVFGWTVASAVVALGISMVGLWEIPVQYAFVIPVVNTILYALKELIADNR